MSDGAAAVRDALRDARRSLAGAAVLSAAVNMLMLAGPLYMLQVYDRVLTSRSVPTLAALTIVLVGAYVFQAFLDAVRSRIIARSAALIDVRLRKLAHRAVLQFGGHTNTPPGAHQPVRELDNIRAFMTATGPIAIMDLPWIPVFLVLCFLIHPVLGFLSLAGAGILLVIAIVSERATREPARQVAGQSANRAAALEAGRRSSEVVAAMGMTGALNERWASVDERFLIASQRAADIVSKYSSISKGARLLLQSAILGAGAYLVIGQELTAGSMIAASIMMGRALAPVETAVANWRTFVTARQSIGRLSKSLSSGNSESCDTHLPAPERQLSVVQAAVSAPGRQSVLVSGISFELGSGDALGIIGPSGAGKTSLLRALVGVWKPAKGFIRLDGATLDQWDPEKLGSFIGYVPQDSGLFDGTISENIARMDGRPDSSLVLAAAKNAGAHEMILRMPAGYDTRIGETGLALSAGQRQRVALARALYRDPFLIALDEPAANLDQEGELALQRAIRAAKARGAIVILIAHRPSALAECNKVLVLTNGLQQAFGSRDETLPKLMPTRDASESVHTLRVMERKSGWSK